jgi:hypothetical protein
MYMKTFPLKCRVGIIKHQRLSASNCAPLEAFFIPGPIAKSPIRCPASFEKLVEATHFRKRTLDLDPDLRPRSKRDQRPAVMIPAKGLVQECRGSPQVAVGLRRR